jgi:quercetin dioxygenase-like cupin family protein
MGRVFEPAAEEWNTVTRRGADCVTSQVLVPAERQGATRLSLTRIEAGGVFGPHIDDYGHVFCVQQGHGEAMVGKLRAPIGPGTVIVTDVDEPHGLWAAPDEPLVLVTANLYQRPATSP